MGLKTYKGPVVFVDGVHYPVGKDGHADTSRPLRWAGDGAYRDAEPDETLHNDANHQADAELEPDEIHIGADVDAEGGGS